MIMYAVSGTALLIVSLLFLLGGCGDVSAALMAGGLLLLLVSMIKEHIIVRSYEREVKKYSQNH